MKKRIGDFNKYGVRPVSDGMMFTFAAEGEGEPAILLYDAKSKKLLERVPVFKEYAIGDVYSVVLQAKNWHRYVYLLEQQDRIFPDPYAPRISGRNHWGDWSRAEENYRIYGGFDLQEYCWQQEQPHLAPRDMIIYKLHMRGYTMRHGLPMSKRGNYKGILDKLRELKEFGVTALEFQPIYDFEELRYEVRQVIGPGGTFSDSYESLDQLNYWGYGTACYMAPKASYFGGDDCICHCKEMIDAIHGMGMEIIMEISFATEISDDYMIDVLEYWVREYRIDGFHILGCNAPMERIADRGLLAETKIFYEAIPQPVLDREQDHKHLFLYNPYFMHVTRQMQNHMQGSMVQFTNHLKRQNDSYGFVNYIANTDGFTLWDSYCYGEKHNEANGENNTDGNNINFSFNYGLEGPTKNRQINQIRLRQVRNGLCCVFLAQGIPLLRSGDEVLNSQEGNNNPYCQDNATGWTIFAKTPKVKMLTAEFVRNLIAFRKAHPVLSMEQVMRFNDYRHLGIPDISYHGEEPWIMGIGEERKAIGILYAGDYADSEDVYVGYNFHYDDVRLALPSMKGEGEWYLVMNTALEESFSFECRKIAGQRYVVVPGRSVSIYCYKKKGN
jgi:glycogen operon protein